MLKPTAENNIAVGLFDRRRHESIGALAEVDRRIDGAVGVQTGDVAASDAAEPGELAADQDAGVAQDGDDFDVVIGADTRIEAGVERAVDIETTDAIADIVRAEAGDVGEETADQNLAV